MGSDPSPDYSDVTHEEARWWTLTDELTPEQLEEKWSPEASQRRYLARYGTDQGRLETGRVQRIRRYVDGQQNPELVPAWWAFAALARELENQVDGRSATAQLWTRHGISLQGIESVLDAAEASRLQETRLREARQPSIDESMQLLKTLRSKQGQTRVHETLTARDLAPLSELTGRSKDSLRRLLAAWSERPMQDAAISGLKQLHTELSEADWNGMRRALLHTQAGRLVSLTLQTKGRAERLSFGNFQNPLDGPFPPNLWRTSAQATVTYECEDIRFCPLLGGGVLSTSCYITDEYHGAITLPPLPSNPVLSDLRLAHHESGSSAFAPLNGPEVSLPCPSVDFDIYLNASPTPHYACNPATGLPFAYRVWINGVATRSNVDSLVDQHFWDLTSQCQTYHNIRVETEGLTNGESIYVNLQATDENGNVVSSVGGVREVSSSVDYGQEFLEGWNYSLGVVARPPGKVCFTQGGQGQVGNGDVTINVRCASEVDLGAQVRDLAPGQTVDVTVVVTANGETRQQTLSFDRDQTQTYTIHGIQGASFNFSADNPNCNLEPADGDIQSGDALITRVECNGSNQTYGVGVHATLDSVPGVPPVSSVNVYLDANAADGSPIPEQSITVNPPNGSYQFPERLPAGANYTLSFDPPALGATCGLSNAGPAVINAPVTAQLTCSSLPTDWCDPMPELCYVPDPNGEPCSIWFGVTRGVVEVCGSDGEVLVCRDHGIAIVQGFIQCDVQTSGSTARVTELGSIGQARTGIPSNGPLVFLRNRSDMPWSGNMPVFGVARQDGGSVGAIELYVDGQRVNLSNFQHNLHDDQTCSEMPASNCNANSRFIGYLDTTTLDDGPHDFLVKATRADGSIFSASESTLTIDNSNNCNDTTPPALSFTTPSNGATLNRGANTVQFNAADSGSGIEWVELRDNGSLISRDTSSPYRFHWNASVGNHTLQGKARDACGNETVRSIQVTVVDPCAGQPAPVVSFPGFEHGQDIEPNLYHFSADVSGGATGGINFVQFQVGNFPAYVDHGAPFSTNGYWLTTEGPVQLSATAHDACGRTGTKTITLNVTHSSSVCQLDTGPPVVTITNPSNGSSHSPGNITITTNASDQSPLRAASLWVNGQYLSGSAIVTGDPSAYRWTWPATSGSHTLQVRVQDVCDKTGHSPIVQVQVQ